MSSLCRLPFRVRYVWRSHSVQYRWYSRYNRTKGNSGITVGNAVLGSSLVIGVLGVYGYDRSRKDPQFKKKIDKYVPGYAAAVDRADEKLKKYKSFFKKQEDRYGDNSNSTVIYQRNEPKPKPDLSKILKGDSSLPQKRMSEEEPRETKSVKKPDDVRKEPADGKGGAGKDKEPTVVLPEDLHTKQSSVKTSDVGLQEEQVIADVRSGGDAKEEVADSSPVSVEKLDKSVGGAEKLDKGVGGSEDVPLSGTGKEESMDKMVHKAAEGRDTVAQEVDLVDSSPSVEKPVPSEDSPVLMKESTVKEDVANEAVQPEEKSVTAVIPVPPPVREDPRWSSPNKHVELLEEAYDNFLEDCREVGKAQEQVKEAWQDLYNRVTSPTEVEGLELHISDAKQATSRAGDHLGAVMGNYIKSGSRLEEVVKKASEEGHTAKASEIGDEVKAKMAELDLRLIQVKETIAAARIAESYRNVVGKSKEKLQHDLEAASSLIEPANKDSLIMSLSEKLEILQRRLKEVDTEYAQNMMIAMEVQKSELDELSEKKLECSLKESEAKHKSQLTKAINEEAAKHKAALTAQMDHAHAVHLMEKREALKELHEKLKEQYVKEMEKVFAFQAERFQWDLAKVQSKLAGIERMVDSVAEAGERTIQFQTLRRLCDSLVGNLENINSDPDYDDYRYVLDIDFSSFREAARDDPFIIAMLNSIPTQAIEGVGIQSEQKLQERFKKVRRTCRGVALVPPEGAGPFVYLLSYIQSILTFSKTSLPQVVDYPELEKMDTYNILYLAEKRMKSGDLEGVVDCMAFLKGEPRRLARDWLEDARLYLETKQAIELLQTYMRAKTFK